MEKDDGLVSGKNLIIIAVFSAAAAIGGLAKLPSPVGFGSIALDSLPGYFVAGFFNPLVGGLVGLIGHLGSAATAGFPLGYLHIAVAVMMFGWCYLFGFIVRSINRRWALYLASFVAIILNGIASPLLLVPLGFDFAAAVSLLLFLTIASAMNVVPAALAVWVIGKLRIRGM